MLQTLLRGTEACLERLETAGERISETHVIWKTAKQLLGWLTTLAIQSEALLDQDDATAFDEIDLETSVGVEVYTARKKEMAARFQADNSENSAENLRGAKQMAPGFFPEVGWQERDVLDQIYSLVWKAVYGKEHSMPLTEVELEKLNKILQLRQTPLRNSFNYHLAVKKSGKHPPC